jgi:hypothetical protein
MFNLHQLMASRAFGGMSSLDGRKAELRAAPKAARFFCGWARLALTGSP